MSITVASLLLSAALSLSPTQTPLVIAHRGASGELPEHTLAAYARAIAQGADYIEPDLVMTKDGHLIARHENEIGGTTDVAQKFPQRKSVRLIDGQYIEGWFSEDFTLSEIRSLRARERLPFRSQAQNGQFRVPTFDEVIQLVQAQSKAQKRVIGIYPETKHPSYFRSIALPLEPALLQTLQRYGLNHKEAPVYIQSFEVSNLQALRAQTPVRLVQLIEESGVPADQMLLEPGEAPVSYSSMITPAGLNQIRRYADGIGPYKRLILPDAGGRLMPPTDLVRDAHAVGLQVHPWTFRSDESYLHDNHFGDPSAEYAAFFDAGVDGIFSDFTAHAVAARKAWLAQRAAAVQP